MWLRKSESAKNYPFPGDRRALDGDGAAFAVASLAADAAVVESGAEAAVPEAARPGHALKVREVGNLAQALATLSGYAAQGLRAVAFLSSLRGIHESMQATPAGRLPFAISLTCRAPKRQAGSLRGGHDDYFAAADTGLFQLFARDAQEAADFTLIAHRIAELSLTPGICAQDIYGTSHSVQNIRLPEPELVRRFLGRPGDTIAAPTPAQRMLFGNERRRVPVMLDVDHPAGLGGVQDRESYLKALAAQRAFFAGHLDGIIDGVMREFGELTGRFYESFSGYRTDDADVIVVAQGSVVDELKAVVDYLRDREKVKAGLAALTVFRPFPGGGLTRLFKGRKALTVLERADQPLAEDLPLLREIRSAIDKALENGMAGGRSAPYPAHDTYRRLDERPRVFSGVYGVGREVPSFAELLAVFRNMLPGGAQRARFYVGADSDTDTRRFPQLQTLEQNLRKDYPDLEELSINAEDPASPPERKGLAFELHSLSAQGGLFAVNLFAQTLSDALGWNVATFPDGGLERSLHPVRLTVWHDREKPATNSRPHAVDAALVSDAHLVEYLPPSCALEEGGALLVESEHDPEQLWRRLSNRAVRWIRDHNLRLYAIDSRRIAAETASRPSFVDQLAIWALLGAWLKRGGASSSEIKTFLDHLRKGIEGEIGPRLDLVDDVVKAAARGAEEHHEVAWQSWQDLRRAGAEAEPPWTVQQLSRREGGVFDATRFWHSVGYLYDTGQADEMLIDPYLATGVIPARSSAFRDMSPYRLRIPHWLPENCTGCGLCWAHCPESALPPTIQSVKSIIDTAMAEGKKAGAAFVQVNRIADHLAKEAYGIAAKDGPRPHATVDALLADAFSRLVKRMNIEGEKLEVLQSEFDRLLDVVEGFPVARTDVFFDEQEKKAKGSGTLLSIALNPLSCTACGICLDVCPDGAFEWAEQTEGQLAQHRRDWQFQMTLPEVPEEVMTRHLSDADSHTHVCRLFDNSAYHSLVGGDGSFPGNGEKTAVHLLSAAVESVMRPRFKAHVERLDDLIGRLEAKIQGRVEDAVKINDFEQFGQRLTRFKDAELTAETLTSLVGGDKSNGGVDRAQLSRLSALLGELREQRRRYAEGSGGLGRARMVMTIDGAGTAFWNGTYPYNPHSHPWLSQLEGDAPALAEGVFEGMTRRIAEEVASYRRAELELAEGQVSAENEAELRRLDWREFSDEEWERVPPVIVVGRSDTTRWHSVLKLLSTGYPVKVAVIDRNGLSVPGRSDETAAAAENPAVHALALRDVFVAQTTIGHPGDMMRGIAEGTAARRPAFFRIYAPDPNLSAIAPEKVAEQARLACESRAFPLFRRGLAGAGLVLSDNPQPDREWAAHELEVRDPSGETSSITAPLTVADWAVREGRYQGHFNIVSRGHLNDRTIPLSDYLGMEQAEREGMEPYIDVTDDEKRHFVAIVSPEMVAASEAAAAFWSELRVLAAGSAAPRGEAADEEERPPQPEAEGAASAAGYDAAAVHHMLAERLLWLSGYGKDPEFFKQSLREFTTRDSKAGTEE